MPLMLQLEDRMKISKEIGRLRRLRTNSISINIQNLYIPIYNVDSVDDVIKRYWKIYFNVWT
jgi:chorismate mutase